MSGKTCFICGNKTKFIITNLNIIKTAHTETPIKQILDRLMGKLPMKFPENIDNNKLNACQNCLIKIDEYDLACVNLNKIENDLYNLFLSSNNEKYKNNVIEISFKNVPMEQNEIISETHQKSSEIDKQNSQIIEIYTECEDELLSNIEYENNMEQEYENTKNKSKGKFKCITCTKYFTSEILLDIHQAVHEGKSELECTICSKVLSSKASMVKHRQMHLQKYNFQCERCGRQFLHDSSFKMHMYAHDDIREVTCEICLKKFRCKPHLKRHMKIHTGEKPHTCPKCGRCFAQRYNMMVHLKNHGTIKKDFQCPVCEKLFNAKKKLKNHIKIHDNGVVINDLKINQNALSCLNKF